MAVDTAAGAVRHAVRADLDALGAALADAFTDDPMMAWIYPDPATRPALMRTFMDLAIEIGFPHGHTYGVGANLGGAIWSPPDIDLFDDATITRFFDVLGEQIGPRAEEVGGGLLQINEHHPHDEPHFYLFVLGTSRAQQGGGLGSKMMREVLDRCDRQGLGAYLESSNTRNVPFYERHGFKVLAEVQLSDEFIARPMWRDPQG
jgi:ribosomal protein S18 acetylase RimI-like enzyme